MANTRISNLTASASNLAASDLVPVVQTPGVGPVKMTGTQIKTGIIGAGSVSITSGKTFTASNTLTLAGTDSTTITFGSASSSFPIVTSPTAATLRLGAADTTGTTAPTAQFLRVQSWSSSTNNNQTGADFTIQGSRGTGTGAGGSIIFQVAPAGSSGTAQNAYSTALTIASDQTATLVGNLTTPRVVAVNGLQFGAGNDGYILGGNGFASFYVSSTYNLYVRNASTSISVDGSWKFGFTNGAANAAPDTVLVRDAANTLALKNSTNPQIFRAYSTTTGPSYGYFASGVTDAGVATADTLFIGTGGAGAAMTKLALVVNGTSTASYGGTNGSSWTFSSTIYTSNSAGINVQQSNIVNSGTSNYIGTISSFFLRGDGDGVVELCGASLTGSGFGRIMFGGTTSSYPALKRSSATLQVRLADDSAFSDVSVRGAIYNGVTFANLPGTPTTGTVAYVTDASNAGAAWGDSVTAGGSTNKYLVWYNGTNWTVVGK